MPTNAITLEMASRLWGELMTTEDRATDDRTSSVAAELRDALGLPEPSTADQVVTVPAGDSGRVLIFDPDGGRYVVKAAVQREAGPSEAGTEAAVVIKTRQGPLVLDADDPLARAQLGVERLRDL